jgi:hypothetical protein
MSDAAMLYIASMLNRMIWRYSYGRKCFKAKLNDVRVFVPVLAGGAIDEAYLASALKNAITRVRKLSSESVIHVLDELESAY